MSGSVEVLWLAENGYHADARLQEHIHHEYYQIYYIMDGEGTFLIDHEPVDFGPEMFFLLTPGTAHGIDRVRPEGEATARLLEVKFTVQDSELNEELSKLSPVCCGTERLRSQLYHIFLEGVRKDAYYEHVVTGLFSAWLYQLIRHCKDFEPSVKKGDFKLRPTAVIKRYLEEHFREDVSLDALAAVTGYSKNYLCRIFRENTGMTINYYLNEVRISKAVDLLAGTDLDQTEIARRCGYNSVFYFIKAFKKRMGIPPGSYRKSELTGVDMVEGHVDSVNSAMRASEVLLMRVNERES